MDPQIAERANQALVAFLRAELQLGFTYLRTARVEASIDSEGEKRARELATDALETIERFLPRITDPAIQEEFRKDARKLEGLVSASRTTSL